MKLGRVVVSRGFLLLMAWLLYRGQFGLTAQGLLACFLHELGHCLALLYFRQDIKEISITVFGAKILFPQQLSYRQELAVAVAGPAINLVLAYLCCRTPDLLAFAGLNLALAVFNLLPVGQLDGSRILRCLLAFFLSDRRTFVVSRCVGFCFTAIFFVSGLLLALKFGNLTLLFVSLWLLTAPGL